jgi:hypothetical protein
MEIAVSTRPRLALAGRITIWSGLLGAASGLLLALRPPAVSADQWSYPQGEVEFALTQTWFAVQHLGLALGIWALWELTGRRSRFGYYAALGGMLALAIIELVAIIPASEALEAPMVVALGVAYGIVAFVIGVGIVAMGVAVIRSGALSGWDRWVPLSLGLWVFFPMMPAIATSFLGARLSIAGWMLLFAALGWVILRREAVGYAP